MHALARKQFVDVVLLCRRPVNLRDHRHATPHRQADAPELTWIEWNRSIVHCPQNTYVTRSTFREQNFRILTLCDGRNGFAQRLTQRGCVSENVLAISPERAVVVQHVVFLFDPSKFQVERSCRQVSEKICSAGPVDEDRNTRYRSAPEGCLERRIQFYRLTDDQHSLESGE